MWAGAEVEEEEEGFEGGRVERSREEEANGIKRSVGVSVKGGIELSTVEWRVVEDQTTDCRDSKSASLASTITTCNEELRRPQRFS